MDFLTSPFATIQLQRLPLRHKETLRAWDSADELLLHHLESISPDSTTSMLVVNDNFGALACSLRNYSVCSWSDSYLAHKATTHNAQLNQLTPKLTLLPSTQTPTGTFQLVLIKIPKTLALLEHQLIELIPCIDSNTVIIAAGMVKYLQASHYALFEKYLGTTTQSLAVKKARLLFPQVEKLNSVSSPYPSHYFQQELQLQLSNHANVFSRDKLDIGARFMIEQFTQLPAARTIVDLGCGNGVLGIMAKRQQAKRHGLDSQIHFVDESYMAVHSAQLNYDHAFEAGAANSNNQSLSSHSTSNQLTSSPHFHVSNCLEDVVFEAAKPVDLILCNPPFHQNNTVGDFIANAMFKQSKKQLSKGGVLWVVGNRHLNYYIRLKRLFGNCRTIASNKKFVVLAATV